MKLNDKKLGKIFAEPNRTCQNQPNPELNRNFGRFQIGITSEPRGLSQPFWFSIRLCKGKILEKSLECRWRFPILTRPTVQPILTLCSLAMKIVNLKSTMRILYKDPICLLPSFLHFMPTTERLD